MRERRSSGSASMRRALILAVIFIAMVFLAQRIPQITRQINTMLSVTPDSGARGVFNEQQQDSLRQLLSGFWSCESESAVPGVAVLQDRIEINKNGIVWRYLRRGAQLPSTDSLIVSSMDQAFIIPFAWADTQQQVLICQVRTLQRLRMIDDDTCYVPPVEVSAGMNENELNYFPTMETVWHIRVHEQGLSIAANRYQPWSDSSLANFFPQGLVRKVEDPAVDRCSISLPERGVLRKRIAEDFAGIRVPFRTAEQVCDAMRDFYLPLCLAPLAATEGAPGSFLFTSLQCVMLVNAWGGVDTVTVSGPRMQLNDWLRTAIVDEIRQWHFGPVVSAEKGYTVRLQLEAHTDALMAHGWLDARPLVAR